MNETESGCVLNLIFSGETMPEIRVLIECLDLILMDVGNPVRVAPDQAPKTVLTGG